MPRLRFRGLRFEILGNLGVVSVLALLLTGLGVWLINGRQMLEQSLAHGTSTAGSLGIEVLENLPGEQPEAFLSSEKGTEVLRRLLDRYQRGDPGSEFVLLDADGRVRVSSVEGYRPLSPIEDSLVARSFAEGKPRTRVEGSAPLLGYFHQAVLVVPMEKSGRFVGGVLVRLSLADVLQSARKTVLFILSYMGLGTIVLVLSGTILVSRTVVRPLERTMGVVEHIKNGNLDKRVPPAGENEVGRLAGAFNAMADQLQAKERVLNENVKALKKMNQMLKQSQQEVIQSEKMASVGLLAAGVAHEIGNPLGAVLGYIGILEKGVDDEAERKDYLARSEQEVLRIHRIVRELREYSRPSPRQIRALRVDEVIRSTVHLVGSQRDFQEIRFDVVSQEGLPQVRVDEGQMQQVLVNLFLNAKDAMERKGVIRVSASWGRYMEPDDPKAGEISCREDDPPGVDFRLLRKNNPARKWPFMQGQDLLFIDVADTGVGISPDDLPRVFDPFFTTKEAGKGTGLGLSVSQRITESFYGDIQIESILGEGTTVRITLPAIPREETGAIRLCEETIQDGSTGSDR